MNYDDAVFEYPDERVDVYPYDIPDGKVTIHHFEDETVIVKIERKGKKDSYWVNKQTFIDPLSGNIKIVQKEK
ncbi:hypothetical protein [Paenibacillus sp. FSL L8-0708]|uniref:hypothetical protein n=1 Tax=Paenibacillus sp. FSL L8-0708 TaxID=2975311 RepID=UPI0030FC6A17